VLRWAALSPVGAEGVTRVGGLPLRIIVGSPSTVFYLGEERPARTCRPDKDQGPYWSCDEFSVPGTGMDCKTHYNRYGSGLGGLYQGASSEGHIRYDANRYLLQSLGAITSSEVSQKVRARWATKDVRFMFGSRDTLHCNVGACANDCENMLTGTNRLQRGLNFMNHLRREFPSSQPLWGIFNFGHNAVAAFASHHFTAWALPFDNDKYRVTDRVVADSGSPMGDYVGRFYAAWECMDKCDSTPGCNSFSYFPMAGQCFLKDKCVSSSSPIVSPDSPQFQFQTYWKDCAASPEDGSAQDVDQDEGRQEEEEQEDEKEEQEEEEGEGEGTVEDACTAVDIDPCASGSCVKCCGDLVPAFGLWGTGWLHFMCKPASQQLS